MDKKDVGLQMISNIPGRTRFKVDSLYKNQKLSNYLFKSLKSTKSINSIEINIISRSLLLKYDNTHLKSSELYNKLIYLLRKYENVLLQEKMLLKYAAATTDEACIYRRKQIKMRKRSEHYFFKQDLCSHNYYKMTVHDVESLLKTNLKRGLSLSKAESLQKKFGLNKFNKKNKKSIFLMLFEQFDGYLMKILLGACAFSAFLGQMTDAIAILAIVFVEAILGVWQNYKAEKSLECMEKYTSQTSKVVRDGNVQLISSENLVPGDIIVLEQGDIVPADARLISSSNLKISESSLTGESEYAHKSHKIEYAHNVSLADRRNMVYGGTKVMRGNGRAIVVRTGMNTEMGAIARLLETDKTELTPLQKDLDRLSKIITWICLGISLVVITTGLIAGTPPLEIIKTGLSLAIGAIPEGLTAILTISLALGVQRIASKGAIVKYLPSVETLSCADVICTDKTGTLTTGVMTVTEIHTMNKKFTMGSNGKFYNNYDRVNVFEDKNLMQLTTIAGLCNNAQISVKNHNETEILGDSTETALLSLTRKFDMPAEHFSCFTRVHEESFNSDSKKMTVICKDTHGNYSINVKGAIDRILVKCDRILDNGKIRNITDDDKKIILESSDNMADNALRVIAFAYKETNDANANEENLIFVGTVGIMDPLRPEVKISVNKCHRAGIRVIMITGDHKKTASAIGRQLNLLDNESLILTGEEIDSLTDEELKRIIDNVAIFARTSPHQKLRIVNILKDKGHIVAMTGDGINDAPAVKEANIGLVMGKSGTDVTKETASIVLTDDNFATIVKAIEEGRGISGNVKRFLRYVLSGNIGTVFAVLAASLLGLPAPLASGQILLINLVTEGVPALALGLDSPNENVMNEPPRDGSKSIFDKELLLKILSRGALMGISAFSLFAGTYLLTGNLMRARTLTYAGIVFNQMFHVFDCREKITGQNKYIAPAIGVSLLTLLASIYVAPISALFGTSVLKLSDWIALMFMAFYIGRLDYLKELASKLISKRMQLPLNVAKKRMAVAN